MSKPALLFFLLTGAGTLVVLAGFFGGYLGARQIIKPPIGTTFTVPAFAYAPSPYQTDATPCLTATGQRVRRGTLATNFLPFGTVLRSEDKYYIVEDRMNPRYNRAVDLFFPSTSEALAFGTQTIDITIVAYGQPGQSLPGEEIIPPEAKATADIEDPSAFQRWLDGLEYLQDWLRASTPLDANRHDVNCFIE